MKSSLIKRGHLQKGKLKYMESNTWSVNKKVEQKDKE